MQIEFYKKSVYGNDMLYIKDEAIANVVRSLTGKKTIDATDIEALKKLGVSFVQVIN